AYQLGYIKGTYVDGKLCYLPNEAITRAEAAVIVANIIDAKAPAVTPVFADSSDIPVFARGAVASLSFMGVLSDDGGSIMASADLTRGDAAEILSRIIQLGE
ncbi:MAG: S-layer homology domain-containing protein, partial [Clostridia bacterium]|nr:S-layer homology domain-containing protein [Clostridia bacterium]